MAVNNNEVEVVITSKNKTKGGFNDAKRDADSYAADIKGAASKIWDVLTSPIAAGAKAVGEGITSALSKASDSVMGFAASFGTASASAIASGGAMTVGTAGINLLIAAALAAAAALAVLTAALIVAAPLALVFGGTVGVAATGVIGLTGAVATLWLGLSGLTDAWAAAGQRAAGGGASQADAAWSVRQATLNLVDAQRASEKASRDVTLAREDETERLKDLSRELTGARLSEEGATLGIARAEQHLRDVRATKGHTALDIAEATHGIAEAHQRLADAQDRTSDLSRQQDEANQKGVEGSDKVQAALKAQGAAQRQVEQSTHALAVAQRPATGAVDKFGEAMRALSPAGQDLIRTLVSLKPRFDDLKKSVQETLLSGAGAGIKKLSDVWIPALKDSLGGIALSFNNLGGEITKVLVTPSFVENVKAVFAAMGKLIDKLAPSLGKFIDALATLGRASTPVLDMLGDLISHILDDFSSWIHSADSSGDLSGFMRDAASMLRDIFDIGGDVLKIFGDIIEILFPTSKKTGGSALSGLKDGLDSIHNWLSDPVNQQKIKDFLKKLQDFEDKLIDLAPKMLDLVAGLGRIIDKGEKFVGWVEGLKDRISRATSGMWSGVSGGFRDAINWVIRHWNDLSFTLGGGSFMGVPIPGFTLSTPDIPYLANGGITGSGWAVVGEQGRELVKVGPGSQVMNNGATEAALAGAGGGGVARVEISSDGGPVGELIVELLRPLIRNRGGNVQLVLAGREV